MTPTDRRRFVVAGLALVGATLAAAWRTGHGPGLRTAPPVIVSEAPVTTIDDTLRAGETVSQLFARRGVTDVDFSALKAAVRNFDPSRLRSGTVFSFSSRDGEPMPNVIAVRASYDSRLRLERDSVGAWAPSVEEITWHAQPFLVEGTVQSSVSEAITSALNDSVLPMESRAQLVWSLADVYDWSLDFSRDVQPGDRFHILAERLVSSEGETRFNRILAARLDVGPHPLYAYRFDDANGTQEFYDENGTSMKREMLRAPLEYKRISSGFSKSRYHPILHYSRPHQGIDFSAAYGAPVRAVGKGTVTYAGRMGGYGNLVEIRHNDHTSTRYAHLSGFGAGITVGAHVEQSQTVGFVGASGLATAPHLHYELRINGVAVNPRRQFAAGQGTPLPEARRPAFVSEKQRLMDMLDGQQPQSYARVD